MQFNLDIKNIKYIKVHYRDDDGDSCTTKTVIKYINERELISSVKLNNAFKISVPQEVSLSIVCHDGLYKTHTKLKAIEKDDPYIFFIFEKPQELEYRQNREFFRVSFFRDCSYIVDGRVFDSRIVDISANGVSIIMPMAITSKEDSELEFVINDKKIKTKVRYVRSEKVEGGQKLSFNFTEISQNDRDLISQMCIKKQLEDKRNSMTESL